MKIPIYQVDAFTNELFCGNPAAVCLLDKWLDEKVMQNIAAENNLAETAFVVQDGDHYFIRWFTPTTEVALCGHATLAAAHVLFYETNANGDEIAFETRYSGWLKVKNENDNLFLDFPADTIRKIDVTLGIKEALREDHIKEVYRGKTDVLVVFEKEEQVRKLKPNMSILPEVDARGVIVTAKGEKVDFVSRFFGPNVGVPEDHVTGSAHTTLIPYWSEKLDKNELVALQVSPRGGALKCKHLGDRVQIGGKSKLYLKGHIIL